MNEDGAKGGERSCCTSQSQSYSKGFEKPTKQCSKASTATKKKGDPDITHILTAQNTVTQEAAWITLEEHL